MAKKMSKGLVALSSAAIVTVYGAGYALTQPAAVSMAAGQTPAGPSEPAADAAPGMAQPGSATTGASTTSASPATTAAASPSQGSQTLKDGVYSGTGWSRHGSVSVKVTIQAGRMVSAPISSVTTRYSQNVIAALPAKVVAAQGSKVDVVSGATDSSEAYQQAVAQALTQAGSTPSAQNSASDVQVTSPSGSIYRNPRRGNGSAAR